MSAVLDDVEKDLRRSGRHSQRDDQRVGLQKELNEHIFIESRHWTLKDFKKKLYQDMSMSTTQILTLSISAFMSSSLFSKMGIRSYVRSGASPAEALITPNSEACQKETERSPFRIFVNSRRHSRTSITPAATLGSTPSCLPAPEPAQTAVRSRPGSRTAGSRSRRSTGESECFGTPPHSATCGLPHRYMQPRRTAGKRAGGARQCLCLQVSIRAAGKVSLWL